MKSSKLLLTAALLLMPGWLASQGPVGVDPALLVKPLSDSWPTYSGDYTGRRYSALKQADRNGQRPHTGLDKPAESGNRSGYDRGW